MSWYSSPLLTFIVGAGSAALLFALAWALRRRRRSDGAALKPDAVQDALWLRGPAAESAPVGIMLTDRNGEILWVNPAFSEIAGFPGDELVGHHTRMLKSGMHDAEVYRYLWETILAGRIWKGELINRNKNGELYQVELSIAPLHNQAGELTHFVATSQGITSRKEVEAARRLSEALYQTLVETLPVSIFRKDLEGRYVFVNQRYCQMSGKSSAEIIGNTDQDLFAPEVARQHQTIDRHVRNTNQPHHAIEERLQENGERTYVQLIKAPVYDALGKLAGVQGLLWDITDSKHAEQEITQRLNELAIVNDISQASASELDVNSLIELVGDRVADTFHSQSTFISVYDRKTGEIYTPYWLHFGERLKDEPFKFGMGLTSRVIESGKPLLINENYEQVSEQLGAIRIPAPLEGRGPQSWLGVPIRVGEEVLGVISALDYEREQAFNESDVRLLDTIASNVGIALKNAQLFAASEREIAERKRAEQKLQQRLNELATIYEVSQAAAAELELDTLLPLVGEQILSAFSAGAAFIALVGREHDGVRVPYWRIGRERLESPVLPLDRGLISLIVASGEHLLIDQNFERRSQELGAVMRYPVEQGTPKTWLGVPIAVRNSVIGVISVQDYEREHAFDEEDVGLLKAIAANVGIAIQNAQLYGDQKSAEASLLRTNEQLTQQNFELNELREQLSEQAIRDPLTDLFNRRYLQETLYRELARADREGLPLSVVMMDLDRFKQFNDQYGHHTGDLLLSAMANLLRQQTRDADIDCRLGGDEFLVVMPGASVHDAQRRAEQIRAAFEQTKVAGPDGTELRGTLSLGVATYPLHANSGEKLLVQADRALYAAKEAGRNRVVAAQES